MVETYLRNKVLTLKSSVTTQENITISIYEWNINNVVYANNTSTLSVNTNDLKLGENTITLKIKNSCGTWSDNVTKTINITDEVINMEKTFEVVVNKSITNVEVVLELTGTVIVTVKNNSGAVVPNASVKIDNVTALTNELGIATLNGITYGTKTGTVTLT